MSPDITNRESSHPADDARIRSPKALGRLARQERKRQKLTLSDIYSAAGLTTRFLSEFERGKPNASLGRVMDALQTLGLELIVLPRGAAERLLAAHQQGADQRSADQSGK